MGLKPEQLDAFWADLASEDAARAYKAVHALALSGDQAVEFLKKDPKPVSGDGVGRLIARLDDDDYATREKAKGELARLGKHIEKALRKALADERSPEARKRLEELIKALEEKKITPEAARGLRGVEVLEAVGSAGAKEVLRELAKGVPEADLTVEAKAALGRLNR